MKHTSRIMLGAVALAAAGCATYTTPAGGVSMAEFADEDLQSFYEREPASPFPANLAVLRVQDAGYATKTSHGYGTGRYCGKAGVRILRRRIRDIVEQRAGDARQEVTAGAPTGTESFDALDSDQALIHEVNPDIVEKE